MKYWRRLDEGEKETGFSLHWWIEGDTGEKGDMEVEPKYLEENEIFRHWMKIFHYIIESQKQGHDKIIDTVKRVKIYYINNKNITKYQDEFQELTKHCF